MHSGENEEHLLKIFASSNQMYFWENAEHRSIKDAGEYFMSYDV